MAGESADNKHRGRRSNLLPAVVVAAAALVGGYLASGLGDDAASASAIPTVAPTSTIAIPATTGAKLSGPPLPAWSYESGDNGPSHWADLDPKWAICAEGTHQSPIEIEHPTAGAVNARFAYATTPAKVTFDGRLIRLAFSPGSGIVLEGVRYDLVSASLHTPSEHTVGGDGFDAELQLLHRNANGDIAIVAILVSKGARNVLLDPLFEALDGQVGLVEPTFGPLALADLLPTDRTAARYTGSLTTPPCTEKVTWIVLTHPVTASIQQIGSAKAITANSARPAQAINDRPIVEGH